MEILDKGESGASCNKVSTLGHYIHNIVQQLDRLLFRLKIKEQKGQLWEPKHEKLIFTINCKLSVFCTIREIFCSTESCQFLAVLSSSFLICPYKKYSFCYLLFSTDLQLAKMFQSCWWGEL